MRKDMSKKISLLLMMLIVVMMVAGCGDKKTDSSKETTTKEVAATGENNGETSGSTEEGNTEEGSTEETTGSDFDFNQVFDNIEVNGKHVPFPFTLNDLGDEYDIEYVVDIGDGIYRATLKYNKETIAGVYYMADSKESINRDSEVYEIVLSEVNKQVFRLKGINCDSNADDVRESIAGLEEDFKEGSPATIEKIQDKNQLFIFFNDDGKIRSIYLIKGGK